jgi:hypothetical protein
MTTQPVRIEPDGIYDDLLVHSALDISTATLAQARRSGALRHTRKGGRTLYLGQWILDWLLAEACGGKEVARAI